jgi:hypothetical protein
MNAFMVLMYSSFRLLVDVAEQGWRAAQIFAVLHVSHNRITVTITQLSWNATAHMLVMFPNSVLKVSQRPDLVVSRCWKSC